MRKYVDFKVRVTKVILKKDVKRILLFKSNKNSDLMPLC